ncbi:cytochrome P450 2D18 [Dendryphion nanum]|uniref:Cytochrome P450 2D18 n=1 Tax=Dendryphion nanum TaxID=256645 RepID=A0A9P9ECZ8_9PLEO|nr:cytochrome P450 2D18 [Dendryphion nanum]
MGSIVVNTLGAIPILCALYLLYTLLRFGSRDKRMPPGPRTIPILGNLHQMDMKNMHIQFKDWADQYGGVFSLKIGGGNMIVLSDPRAVHDLMNKKSAIYSDKPIDHQMLLCLQDENIAFMPSTQLWRAERKIASQSFSPKALDERLSPISEAEISQLMADLLNTPENFRDHIKRATASAVSIATFGFRAPTMDNFFATAAYLGMDTFLEAVKPGTYLPIEQFPILKYIPDRWNPSIPRAKKCYETVTKLWAEARRRVEERRNNGDIRVSLADRLISGDIKSDTPLSDRDVNHLLGAMLEAGADTTSTSSLIHILFLAKNTWVQEKARMELDIVCGTARMPDWSDFKDLPYINCIIKEGMRIRPLVPTGVPHRVTQDDWYDGMFIPRDSTVIVPQYAMHFSRHCTSQIPHFKDPETYNPDRYLEHIRLANDYAGSPDFMNRDHYVYGAGRRICVGIHLAERTQWRILARLLWAFKIEPAIDETTGLEIPIDADDFEVKFMNIPRTFKVQIKVRSARHAEVIRQDLEKVKDFLKSWN